MSRVLTEILKTAQSGPKTLALFDLDSTLFDLRPRTAQICRSFGKQQQADFPSETENLSNIQFLQGDFGLEAPMARLGYSKESPFFQALHAFWRPRFFSNEYLHHDQPIEGAADYVNALMEAGAIVKYISGRHQNGMREGTIKSLLDHGFPLSRDHSELCLKPEFETDDAEFKVELLGQLLSPEVPAWLFENEPVNINRAAEAHPNLRFVFVDTCHSGRETIDSNIPVIRNFLR